MTLGKPTRYYVFYLLGVCAAAGSLYACYLLFRLHATGATGSILFDSVCRDAMFGAADCKRVVSSPWSYFPPNTGAWANFRLRLPAALMGLVYYLGLLIWLLAVGVPACARRWVHLLPMTVVAGGLAMSAYFTVVMFARLDQWCPWCLFTHVMNVLIAVSLVMLWPRKAAQAAPVSAEPARSDSLPAAPVPVAASAHPSLRLVVTTLAAILFASYGMYNLFVVHTYRPKAQVADHCLSELARYEANAAALLVNWQDTPRQEVDVRLDDPVRAMEGADGPVCVVFSDFECPGCRQAAEWLEQKVAPLFGGHLRLVFKHYPLDASCNRRTAGTRHPNACRAARLAEAARMIGGAEAFWKAHDYLFAHQQQLSRIQAADVAAVIGCTAAELESAAALPACTERIAADVELGARLNLRGTPAVFLNGRFVDAMARNNLTFWDQLAAEFWRSTGRPRPEDTLLRETPSSDNRAP